MRHVLFTIAIACAAVAQPATKPDVETVIRKSLERDFFDFTAVKDYTYIQREEVHLYNTKGKLTSTVSNEHEIFVLGGSPYEKLIARNDKPLSEGDTRKEKEKMDKEHAKREHLSDGERAKAEKNRQEQRKYLGEVPQAFALKLLGDEQVSGLPAWVVEGTPKPDYKPQNPKAKIFSKLSGKVWINQVDYHWVKMEAIVNDSLSYGLGLFKIAEGAEVKFEQKRINDEVWLPSHTSIHGDVRVGYLKKLRIEIDITYRDYRKFQTDSKIVSSEEK